MNSSARKVWNLTAPAPAAIATSMDWRAKSRSPLKFTPISATTIGGRAGDRARPASMKGAMPSAGDMSVSTGDYFSRPAHGGGGFQQGVLVHVSGQHDITGLGAGVDQQVERGQVGNEFAEPLRISGMHVV